MLFYFILFSWHYTMCFWASCLISDRPTSVPNGAGSWLHLLNWWCRKLRKLKIWVCVDPWKYVAQILIWLIQFSECNILLVFQNESLKDVIPFLWVIAIVIHSKIFVFFLGNYLTIIWKFYILVIEACLLLVHSFF